MSADDYRSTLRKFHVTDAFSKVRELTSQLGFRATDATTGQPLDLRAQLENLAKERHASAHDSSHSVSTMWLKTVGNLLIRFGLGFDILASVGAANLRAGTPDYLANDEWMTAQRVSVHLVVERKSGFAHVREIGGRASKVLPDGDDLFRLANRNRAISEIVARLDRNERVTDWTIPSVG
ncbi:hypothetical protein [Paenarthrobacter sp. Y-19]|uniref:hypothetical protein n=1 Tax=Paenarthrobacter sp. Y-19 TaxID=3031125 RepID=UPI0023DB6723|nr:hypothetical protein [Paenarthrobacter sp. Y-19]